MSAPTTQSKPGLEARRVAAKLLAAIIDARTPMDALTDDSHGHPQYLRLEARDRSLVRAILMAALRYRADLERLLERLLDRPLPTNASALRHILDVGLTQILFMDVPDHSAVDLAVEAASSDPRTRRFSALVNAVTRRAVRSKQSIHTSIAKAPAFGPDWFVAMLQADYGGTAEDILHSLRQPSPTDLTLHPDGGSAEDFARAVSGSVLNRSTIRLSAQPDKAISIPDLPGFTEGRFWVQDVAATIPAALFGPLEGKRVLDCCAAPGGKTAQLLAAGGQVTALDKSKNRLQRLLGNMERLRLTDRLEWIVSDVFDHEAPQSYDAVLVDAPCSSTGTMRRHPDVSWVKTTNDIDTLAALQLRMLDRAASFVAPGGTLVFSNCSLAKKEGEEVARQFARQHPEFAIDRVKDTEIAWLPEAVTEEGFVRTHPAMLGHQDPMQAGLDGFFCARFTRR